MRLLGAFIAHEAKTQLRSTRFRVLSVAYITAGAFPAVAVYLASANLGYVMNAGGYAAVLEALLPALTALFATVMAVDAITREREEGSFPVISLAPLSASRYLLNRWLAVLVLAIPVTTGPYVIAAGLLSHASRAVPDLAPLAWEWLLHSLPPLIVMSGLMLALGTITSRTILAVLVYAAGATYGLGLLQDVLAFRRRHFEGPGELFGFDPTVLSRLIWALRGWWQFDPPTAAGYPVEAAIDALLPEAALVTAVTVALLGLAPAFLGRTRRDVRPWRIGDDHPMRTMLRGLNRLREEYRPDAGLQTTDRLLMAGAALLSVIILVVLVRRDTRFTRLAHERYAAEQAAEPGEMSKALLARTIAVEGAAGRTIETRATFDFENRGGRAERHLAFSLHPGLRIVRVDTACGAARITRRWDRVGLDLASPLAPGRSCRITFKVAGRADAPRFNLRGKGAFGARYRYWRDATSAIDLSDLSRSTLERGVTRQRLALSASDFAPVPRYTPWTLVDNPPDPGSSFAAETYLPEGDVRVSLRLPEGFTAADSCGSMARERLQSRCVFSFAEFRLLGARFDTLPLEGGATLAHLRPHAELARMHAPALGEAVTIAERAWPGLRLGSAPLFVEQPIDGDGERASWVDPRATLIDASGRVFFIPEWLLIRRKSLGASQIAASIVATSLRSRRAVAPAERRFFDSFYAEVARARTGGGEQRSAVISGRGPLPSTEPLARLSWGQFENARLRAVIVDLEYRVGSDRLAEAVNQFVEKEGAGTARELLDTIGRHAGVSLQRFYSDYFEGQALPKLTLEEAVFQRDGRRWMVRGVARNAGSGEVFCPVVLRTQFSSVRDVVRIGSGERVPFTLTTEHEPRTLQLDPDRVVYRHAAVGTVDSADYRGQS